MDSRLIERRALLASTLALGGALAARRAAAADTPPPDVPGGLTVAPTSQAGASPRLTFHAVDTFHGASGAGLKLQLSRYQDGAWRHLTSVATVAGGRTAEPLLVGDAYVAGRYEVLMNLGDYFERLGARLPSPSFLNQVPLRIVIHDPSRRVHLPVLFSPWGYSFYRGS